MQGLADRIVDGKLHLTVKDFLELVLKNSTEINLTRLDVYTAADQITAAKAPSIRLSRSGSMPCVSVSPQSTQIGGASTLSSLTQNSFVNYPAVPADRSDGHRLVSSRTRSSTNSAFNLFNPNISGILSFLVAQPLLQNRIGIQFRRRSRSPARN